MASGIERRADANYRVIFARFAEITQKYTSADSEERRKIEEELERVANGGSLSPDETTLRNPEIQDTIRAHYSIVAKSFNGKDARIFRESLGLSRKKVAEQCGIHPQVIGQYEGRCPDLPTRATRNVVMYLGWLKSKGFNLDGAI